MSENVTINIEILKGVFGDIAALKKQLGSVTDVVTAMDKSMGNASNDIRTKLDAINGSAAKVATSMERTRAIDISAVIGGLSTLQNELNDAIQPGIEFNSKMADLEALTGVTGKGLDDLAEKARAQALVFGGDASRTLTAYKLVLSQLGPDLAKTPEALDAITRGAQVLSKGMGNDLTAATEAITTTLNQYSVNANDPLEVTQAMTRAINVLAAAAKEGSAEVPDLSAAMKESGRISKLAGVDIETQAAALEELAKSGKKGSEAGVGLRNMLIIMSKGEWAEKTAAAGMKALGIDLDKVADSSVPFTERLREMAPLLHKQALLGKAFGQENVVTALSLLQGTEAMDEMKGKITGTNEAQKQADVVMGSYQERVGRMTAKFKDWGISIFNVTKDFAPLLNVGMSGLQVFSQLKLAQEGLAMVMNTKLITSLGAGFTALRGMSLATMAQSAVSGIVTGATKLWTAAQWAINAAMDANPIGLVILAIAALVAAVIWLVNHWKGVTTYLEGMWESWKIGFQGLVQVVTTVFDAIVEIASGAWKLIKAQFNFGEVAEKMRMEGLKQMGKGLDLATHGVANVIVKTAIDQKAVEVKALNNAVATDAKDQAEKERKKLAVGMPELPVLSSGKTALDANSIVNGAGAQPEATAGKGKKRASDSGDGITVGGGKSGDGRVLNMNVTMNVQFPIGRDVQMDANSVADKVVAILTNKFRDAEFALG